MPSFETLGRLDPIVTMRDSPFVRGYLQSTIMGNARKLDEGQYTHGLVVVRNGEDTQISIDTVARTDRLEEEPALARLDISIDEQYPKYETWIKVCGYMIDDLDNSTNVRDATIYKNKISGEARLLFMAASSLRKTYRGVRAGNIVSITTSANS